MERLRGIGHLLGIGDEQRPQQEQLVGARLQGEAREALIAAMAVRPPALDYSSSAQSHAREPNPFIGLHLALLYRDYELTRLPYAGLRPYQICQRFALRKSRCRYHICCAWTDEAGKSLLGRDHGDH